MKPEFGFDHARGLERDVSARRRTLDSIPLGSRRRPFATFICALTSSVDFSKSEQAFG